MRARLARAPKRYSAERWRKEWLKFHLDEWRRSYLRDGIEEMRRLCAEAEARLQRPHL